MVLHKVLIEFPVTTLSEARGGHIIPAVLMPVTGIKVRSSSQAVKLSDQDVRFALLNQGQDGSYPLTPHIPAHPRLVIKGQGSFSGAIKRSRSKNGRDQILIPVADVSIQQVYNICDHPLLKQLATILQVLN